MALPEQNVAMRAIISDIHANKEALEAVLRTISGQGVDEIWCLGDIVGYGPDPNDCVDLIRKNCSVCLMGNHDWAVVHSPVGFNSTASRMIYRTKEWMLVGEEATDAERERWQYIVNLPLRHTHDGYLMVHASPRSELTEYILPADVHYDRGKLLEILAITERFCFVGHTHIPCLITEDVELITPGKSGARFELGEKKMIVNIGSVGQPRDMDNRACYVTLQDDVVTYHRVPYRFGRTSEKLLALGEGCEMLAHRLAVGR